MSDILERLRWPKTEQGDHWPIPNLHEDAADEIERLRESLEWLRATFRLNMIRACPNMPHEEIDEKIKFVEEYPNRTLLGESDE